MNEKIRNQKKKIINITDNDIVILKTFIHMLIINIYNQKLNDFLCNTLFKNKIAGL